MTPMQLWTKALRSGKYKQTVGRLNRDNLEFCCLGIACEVALADGVDLDVSSKTVDSEPRGLEISYNDHTGSLPDAVAEWLGIDSDGGLVFEDMNDKRLSLAVLNDGGMTFDQIADIIDAGLVDAAPDDW